MFGPQNKRLQNDNLSALLKKSVKRRVQTQLKRPLLDDFSKYWKASNFFKVMLEILSLNCINYSSYHASCVLYDRITLLTMHYRTV